MIVKKFSGIESIKIESSAKVSIVKGQEFQVTVSGDDAEKVKIQQSGSEVEINYLELVGSFSLSGGSFNIGSVGSINTGNIRIAGDSIAFADGKRVNKPGVVDSDPTKKPVEIEIQCPDVLSIQISSRKDKFISDTGMM